MHITIDNRDIEITHPDKELFSGIRKETFVRYYHRIGPTMLPYMKDRPITMRRFPRGVDEDGFFQKDTPNYFPDWIPREQIEKKQNGTTNYVICNNLATLAYLANQDCIEPHIWLSTIEKPNNPDRMIFDFDPPEDSSFEVVREFAFKVRDVLENIGLTPFVMTTGSKGVHVTTPLDASEPFEESRSLARAIADYFAEKHPQLVTTEIRKEKRSGRLFLDTNRNSYAQTGISPYGVRAKPGAPVATPIRWDELAQSDLMPQSYTIENIFRRMGQVDDPWQSIDQHKSSVKKAHKEFKKKYSS